MTPARLAGPAYWASGGGVESRVGPVGMTRAVELLRFFRQTARETSSPSDLSIGALCDAWAAELDAAIRGARAWRRASDGLTPWAFARRTKTRRYG